MIISEYKNITRVVAVFFAFSLFYIGVSAAKDNSPVKPDTSVDAVKFNPRIEEGKGVRNPFLSPADEAAMKAEAERIRMLRQRALQKSKPKITRKVDPIVRVKRSIKLQGIVDNGAIVNDRSVKAGDMVNGAKVIQIKKDRVVFSFRGKLFVVKMP